MKSPEQEIQEIVPYQRIQGPTVPLSENEREVLIYSARGLTREETGVAMGKGTSTVKAYMGHAQKKLLETNATGAVTRALNSGELSLDEI